tara:strand:- start:192 stop:332 length:141 start_codon:yes stop_codon:yes gene_type:complete
MEFKIRLKEVQNIITAQKVVGLNPAEVTKKRESYLIPFLLLFILID